MTDYTKGGRGKVAPYESTHCRIPVAVKPLCEQITTTYKKLINSSKNLEAQEFITKASKYIAQRNSQDNKVANKFKSKEECIETAKKIIKSKKSAKASLAKLISEVYDIKLNPEDLN